MERPKPKFKHDCKACTFIGQALNSDGNISDWYVCAPAVDAQSTLIIRDGSDGPDYASYPFEVFVRVFLRGLAQTPKFSEGARLDFASIGIHDEEDEDES